MVLLVILFVLIIIFLVFKKTKTTETIQSTFFQEKLKQLRKRKRLFLLEKSEQYFSKLFDYILTDEQIDSVINESSNSIVIASAGSGKTSTIVSKYGYLIQSQKITDKNILVLAFNNKVAKEIKEKIDILFGVDSHVYTFHSLGKEIITSLLEDNKDLDDLALEDVDGILTTSNVERIITKAREQYPEINIWINDFRILCPYHKIETFAKNEKGYKQAISLYPYKREKYQIGEKRRPLSIPTINGEYFVKSQEELAIANFLIMKGVNFKYEKAFPIQSNNSDFGVYTPDFYYPDADLWHEHFAFDKKGNPPDFFVGYKEEAEWKKEFHTNNGTRIIYTYSYQFNEDIIFEELIKQLEKYQLDFHPINQNEIDSMIGDIYIDDTYKLIKTCMKLAKTKNYKVSKLIKLYDKPSDQFRSNRFKRFFIPLLKVYQNILNENNTIDFEDMINQSAELLKNIDPQPYKSKYGEYKHIFVDEFQDISSSRSNFLKNLRGEAKLFCVGDDWQSIYRFTGADNTIIKSFDDIFESKLRFIEQIKYSQNKEIEMYSKAIENSEDLEFISQLFIDDAKKKNAIDLQALQDPPNSTFMIQDNFRTGDIINNIASNFIQKNPFQIKKQIKSKNLLQKKQTDRAINFCEISNYDNKSIEKIINLIPRDGLSREVFILGRKNFDFIDIKPELLMNKREDLSIKKSTIHKAKGMESDVVILLGLDGGMKGFPNKNIDDPLLSMFLPTEDLYEDSEERRVMYVAMTRAKEMIFLVNKIHNRSEFIDEIIEICKETNTIFNEHSFNQGIKLCPKCEEKDNKKGVLNIRRNREKKSIFLGCNFFFSLDDDFQCSHTEDYVPCPNCVSKGVESELNVNEKDNLLLIICDKCNYSEKFD